MRATVGEWWNGISLRAKITGVTVLVLTLGLVGVLRFHSVEPLPSGAMPDMSFIDDMGWLMAWGTALLFVDAILIILLYEALGRVLRGSLFLRILASVAAILTFDQIGFFTVLHIVTGVPLSVFVGGWAGKMAAAIAKAVIDEITANADVNVTAGSSAGTYKVS